MQNWFSANAICKAPMRCALIVVVGLCFTHGPAGYDAVAWIAASARSYAGPVVLVQYNPCPNGRCR